VANAIQMGKIFLGLFECPATGFVFNADLVGAFNILKKSVRKITLSLGGFEKGERSSSYTIFVRVYAHACSWIAGWGW